MTGVVVVVVFPFEVLVSTTGVTTFALLPEFVGYRTVVFVFAGSIDTAVFVVFVVVTGIVVVGCE